MTYPPEPLTVDECRRLIVACNPRFADWATQPGLDRDAVAGRAALFGGARLAVERRR